MNFYDRWVLPWLIELCMRNKEARRYRELMIPLASGRVLEVGVGSGLNLPFYGAGVRHLYALEPSPELRKMAGRRTKGKRFTVEFLDRSAEDIPLDRASVDTVVTTWTLCTIPDAVRALEEIRRVLKPAGVLLFVEHGLAPDPGVRAWQRRLNPLWNRIGGGCNLDRKIDALIAGSGFRLAELETEYAKGLKPLSFTYSGRAVPA
ncbi:MAG: class I SAM-dependent methyltransferase [Candidatus Omnitrophica bacterium]|nr:class I SAM-dependent methyltransferase [Candidatus Omnitrophota bacterium]